MDPIKNPFSPGAGTPPPELVGRDEILNQITTGLARIKASRPERSRLLTGLRGVGKTVLLTKIGWISQEIGCVNIAMEAMEGRSLADVIIPVVKDALFSLNKMQGAMDKISKGVALLRGFIGGANVKVADMEFGLNMAPELGQSQFSGQIEEDLPPLLIATAEAAKDRKTAVVILVDEMQYLDIAALKALIFSLHKAQQQQLPLFLVGAGLPDLPGLAAEAVSYAERLFLYPHVGPLSREDTEKALLDPTRPLGVTFDQSALKEIFKRTQGYPYFVQEWGSQAWNLAPTETITLAVAKKATQAATRQLDESFFRARFDRLTPHEKNYLRAMAQLGSGPYRTGDIANLLGVQGRALGPARDKLIKKGMIYSPSHGLLAFTVPLFDEFIRRAMTEFTIK